jgi:oxalate decarboxylase/phosphoglucose isomerase-like protein (cupin superfamily)
MSVVFSLYYGTPLVLNNLDTIFTQLSETVKDIRNEMTVIEKEQKLQELQKQLAESEIPFVSGLDEETFKSKYYGQKPVLFKNSEFAVITNKDSLPDFLGDAYSKELHIPSLESIYFHQEHAGESKSLQFTLQDYLSFQYSLDPSLGESSHFYASDANITRSIPDLSLFAESFFHHIPSISSHLLDSCRLAVGHQHPALSGTSFHLQRERVSYLLEGQKSWMLFSSEDYFPSNGFNPLKNLEYWRNSTAEGQQVHTKLLHVHQNQGEVLYIPEGWYHATQTISDHSVSLTWELQSSDQTPAAAGQKKKVHFYFYLDEGNQRLAVKDFKGAIRMFKMGLAIQRNILLLERLADVYVLSEMYLAAEELYREIIDINPLNPAPYGKLIELLIDHATRDVSDSIAHLLQQAEAKGIKEDVLRLTNDQL